MKIFHNGSLVRAGLATGTDEDAAKVDLSKMTKDELLAVASERGVEVDVSATKSAIIAALTAPAAE